MKSMNKAKRALVLSGGGAAGLAWGLGFIAGLAHEGLNLQEPSHQPDFVIGTSGGSAVAALLFQPVPLQELFEQQLLPVTLTPDSPAASFNMFDVAGIGHKIVGPQNSGPRSDEARQMRQQVGEMARKVSQEHAQMRLAEVASNFPNPNPVWPEQHVAVVAVDTETGQEQLFTKDSGVPLVQVVAASRAVPGVWPSVEIEGRWYTDGGVRSLANGDLAQGYDKVLLLSLSAGHEHNPQLQYDQRFLEKTGSQVLLLGPDKASVAAIGPNPLVATTRGATAQAALAQGKRVAQQVQAFWE